MLLEPKNTKTNCKKLLTYHHKIGRNIRVRYKCRLLKRCKMISLLWRPGKLDNAKNLWFSRRIKWKKDGKTVKRPKCLMFNLPSLAVKPPETTSVLAINQLWPMLIGRLKSSQKLYRFQDRRPTIISGREYWCQLSRLLKGDRKRLIKEPEGG